MIRFRFRARMHMDPWQRAQREVDAAERVYMQLSETTWNSPRAKPYWQRVFAARVVCGNMLQDRWRAAGQVG